MVGVSPTRLFTTAACALRAAPHYTQPHRSYTTNYYLPYYHACCGRRNGLATRAHATLAQALPGLRTRHTRYRASVLAFLLHHLTRLPPLPAHLSAFAAPTRAADADIWFTTTAISTRTTYRVPGVSLLTAKPAHQHKPTPFLSPRTFRLATGGPAVVVGCLLSCVI